MSGTDESVPTVSIARPGPCRLRRAEVRDAAALGWIQRETFPTQWPPIQFRRELKRQRTVYVLAVRDLPASLQRQDRGDSPAREESGVRNGARAGSGILNWLFKGLRQIAFVDPAGDLYEPPRDRVAGFVGIWLIADEAHVVSIGVRDSERRRGVGELLLIGAFKEARRLGAKKLTLEVRKSNQPARSLYRKYGFLDVGVRKRYYMDNGEDAIIMTTPPITSVEYTNVFGGLVRDHAARWGHSVQASA